MGDVKKKTQQQTSLVTELCNIQLKYFKGLCNTIKKADGTTESTLDALTKYKDVDSIPCCKMKQAFISSSIDILEHIFMKLEANFNNTNKKEEKVKKSTKRQHQS